MRKLQIGIIDIVSKGPTKTLYARVMNANLASIMPQVIGVWCRQAGHDVTFVCYTGFEDLLKELPGSLDVVFIGAFTEAAHTAYALSSLCRSKGAITILGGPHARCYPEDAARYFDYVLGFTDRETLVDVLNDNTQHRPLGVQLSAARQPKTLPGVRERWEFMEPTLKKAPFLKMIPMLGSLGCPYTCSFCIDAVVPYQSMDGDVLREDLKFLLQKFRKPLVAWHDPNFGVQFDHSLDIIEEAVPAGRMEFAAESSLSLLSEPHLKRLKRNGFLAILPGIESWFDLGGKSKTGALQGMEKVRQVADHVNLILKYIPYLQTNFVLGLDSDHGAEPFELTKRFLDMAPGAFPGYSLLTAFGRAAALNLEYQEANRVLPFPFHFLNNNGAMNVKPRNYSWREFYGYLIGLQEHSFSSRLILKRFGATRGMRSRWMNLMRAVSSEGRGRLGYYKEILHHLETDPQFPAYFDQRSTELPDFYVDIIRKDLGALWQWLPAGALHHDSNAYLKAERGAATLVALPR